MPNLFRLAGIAICLAFILEAIGQVSPQFHRIPARPVREMLAAQHITNSAYSTTPCCATTNTAQAARLSDIQPLLAVRKIIIGISRPLVMLPGPPDPTASLILEPMTNGCFLVVVTNADADVTWTLQTSTNLTCCWTDGLSLSNATSYVFTNCFPDGVDNMFLRLLDP